jgi:hypothetical protein
MTSITTTTLAPLKQPASIQQAKAQCRLGASLFATYAILATAQWAAVGDLPDQRAYLGGLGFDLAVAAGIWLNSRAFATVAILLCLGRTAASISQFETYSELVLSLSLLAVGWFSALAGASGSFALRGYGHEMQKSPRAKVSLPIVAFGAFASLAYAVWWMWPHS